jgi:hypothetical protein
MKYQYIALTAATILSGCSGGGGSQNASTPQSASGSAYSNGLSDFDRIRRDSARVATIQGYTETLPTSGTASYAGVTSFSEDANPRILATTNLVANFSDSSISGSLSNFKSADGTVFQGSMNMTNGFIDSTNGSVSTDISGRLTSNSARMSTVDADGEFVGQFIGGNHQYLRGMTSALWITNGGTGTEEQIRMQGELAVEKQY